MVSVDTYLPQIDSIEGLEALRQEFSAEYRRALVRAVRKITKMAYNKALDMSSGDASLYELQMEDHPFATRHPAPLWDPAIINVQSGEFLEAWQIDLPDMDSVEIAGKVWNDHPHGDFFEGTDKMVPRPIQDVLVAFVDQIANQIVQEEVDKFMQQYG